MLHLMELMTYIQERFGGNAANIEAGTSQLPPFLHADSAQSQLSGLYSRNISPRAAPNYSQVELFMLRKGSSNHYKRILFSLL